MLLFSHPIQFISCGCAISWETRPGMIDGRRGLEERTLVHGSVWYLLRVQGSKARSAGRMW